LKKTDTTPDRFQILKKALQEYQAERIRKTYSDIEKMPEYTKLAHFFFDEIYAARDFGFRNEGIKSLHHKLSGFLKGEIINAVGEVIELNELTEELDNRMVEKMIEFDIGPNLNDDEYRRIYQSLNNHDQRVYQIDLLVDAVKAVHHISQMRFIGLSLKVVNTAAHIAGFGKIMDFLYHGYEAFHSVKDIYFFATTIRDRELEINERLFQK
jgi:hypothetical protein